MLFHRCFVFPTSSRYLFHDSPRQSVLPARSLFQPQFKGIATPNSPNKNIQTLPKNFQSPPQPLLETRERINQTLLKIFQSDSARKILSRPYL